MSPAPLAVKGWCPGALRPMPSGDGLIVRIRPFCGALDLGQARALADLAERLGNGHIDLTRRANLQIRGLAEERLPALHEALGLLGLIDGDAETEAVRNVMVAPLAGIDPAETCDVRPIATALERALVHEPGLRALPGKFGLLVDGGGTLSIAGERADICLAARHDGIAVGLDTPDGTAWLGLAGCERAAEIAIAAACAFLGVTPRRRLRDLSAAEFAKVREAVMPSLSALAETPHGGGRRLGRLPGAVGIAAPFGRLEARQLRRLAALAADAEARDIRLSPWRAVYVGVREEDGAQALLDGARDAGLIVESDDPLVRIEACPGAPDCASSSVDARGDARRLAALAAANGYRGLIHVSGCVKGCARSDPAELVLVGQAGLYGLLHDATARDPVERRLAPSELPSLFAGPRHG